MQRTNNIKTGDKKKPSQQTLSYRPTLLRNPPKKGTIIRQEPVWYVGSKLRKGGELGKVYKGPFVHEVSALECIGESGWYVIKVTKKGNYKVKWYWQGLKWYRR